MFTYVTLGTNDPPRAARFYDAVLGALGLERCDVSEPEGREGDGLGADEQTGRTGDPRWDSPPLGSCPPNPDEGVRRVVPGAMAESGDELLRGTSTAGR